MSEPSAIKTLLADEAKVGNEVTVQGWIRSKRDSKAGISFLAINDGSHFDSLQCVVANTLSNYELRYQLSTGCSVIVSGKLISSQGQGQSVEIQASTVTVIGDVDDPSPTRSPKNATHLSTFVRKLICAPEPTPLVPLPGFATN